MRLDEAFKLLLSEMPEDILHAFADDVAQAWGDPGKVTVETVELLPRVKGLRRSRYFDLAVQIRCRPCPVGGAALVRVGHADRCPSCGALLRDPDPGELGTWAGAP